jgi:hypothetical protein
MYAEFGFPIRYTEPEGCKPQPRGKLMNKVVRIGSFFGGSFGVAGHPNRVYDYFAVDSDINAATSCSDKCELVAFCSEAEAYARMELISTESRIAPKKK